MFNFKKNKPSPKAEAKAQAQLAAKELNRLGELSDDVFGWRMSVSVKEHFNNAGKFQQFADASTPVEQKEQLEAMRGLFSMTEEQAAMATLKAADVFMRVARRVGDDADLGKLLPEQNLAAGDADLLDKYELKSLAAVVRARLKP